jgi:hypothetical protein
MKSQHFSFRLNEELSLPIQTIMETTGWNAREFFERSATCLAVMVKLGKDPALAEIAEQTRKEFRVAVDATTLARQARRLLTEAGKLRRAVKTTTSP